MGIFQQSLYQIGSIQLELNEAGEVVSDESYYPYGGTAIWATKNQIEAKYKYHRYSGKERDVTGLYYYGYRYYLPWLGRWLNPDPSGIIDRLNLFCFVGNNPTSYVDPWGLQDEDLETIATQAYDRMLGDGSVWSGIWNSGGRKTSLEAIQNLSRNNILRLEELVEEDGREARDVAAQIQEVSNAAYILEHFSKLSFVEASGGVEFLSRSLALKKLTPNEILSVEGHTKASDLRRFATDQFVFFSLETQGGVKSSSRFGSYLYSTRLSALGESFQYSHLALGDLLLIQDDSPREIERERARALPFLPNNDQGLDYFLNRINIVTDDPLSKIDPQDALFYGDQMIKGLALSIALDLQTLDRENVETVLEWTNPRGGAIERVGQVINAFYRPQVLVPGKLRLNAGEFDFTDLS